jgi:hypothetical protein
MGSIASLANITAFAKLAFLAAATNAVFIAI